MQQASLLPREMFSGFSEIFHNYPKAFPENILTSEGELERFAATRNSGASLSRNYSRRCIPVSIHGDDVPVV